MGTIISVDCQRTLTLKLLCVRMCLSLFVIEGKWIIRTPLPISLTLELPNIMSYCHVILLTSKCHCLAWFTFHRQTGILSGFKSSPH